MKNTIVALSIAFAILASMVLITACGGKTNKTFGKLPAMAKSCSDAVQEIRAKQEQLSGNAQAMQLQKNIVEIKNEAVKNIENEFLNMVKPVEVPFTQEGYKGRYTIESIRVTRATYNTIHLEAVAGIIDTTIYNFVAYAKFYNNSNEELPGWAALLSNRDSIAEGKVFLRGTYNQLDQLTDFKEIKTFDNHYYREHETQ